MNATCEKRRTQAEREPPARSASEGQSKPSLARRAGGAVLIILAGYLLFAHGCHGDEDNELFTSFRQALSRLCQN